MQQPTPSQTAAATGIDFKDLTAVLPLMAAVFTYYGNVRTRAAWTRKKRQTVGELGLAHWWLDRLPNGILAIVSVLAIISSLAYFAYKLFGTALSSDRLRDALQLNYDYYPYLFFAWLVFAVLGYFNIISRTLIHVVALFPAAKRSIGFANASWHIESDDAAAAVSLSNSNRGFAEQVLTDLVQSAPNPNLALRPANVTDEEAANILYFGHVVEEHRGLIHGAQQTGWTQFYELMGAAALENDRPFSSTFLRNFAGQSFFYSVLKRYDAHAQTQGASLLSDSQQLEEAVGRAFEHLLTHLRADARTIGSNWRGGHSYDAALRNSARVLDKPELQMQFAKLAIIWNIWGPKVSAPAHFRIPFSAGILLLLLDEHQLLTDAEQLDTDDWRLRACVERVQESVLELGYDALQKTKNPAITAWRQARLADAQRLGINWRWYVFYRMDQHMYHMGRGRTPVKWERRPGTNIIAKKAKS